MIKLRWLRWLLLALAVLILLQLPCAADEAEDLIGEGIDPAEGLPESVLSVLGGFDASSQRSFAQGALQIAASALKALSPSVRSGLCSAGLILAAVVLCSLLSGWSATERISVWLGTLAIAGACVGGMRSMLRLASDTVRSLNRYGLLLLPGLGTLSTLAGSASGAAGCTAGMVFLDVLLTLCSRLLLPLVTLYAACCTANTAIGGSFASVCDFLKWLAGTILKWTMYAFTGYLSISGIVGAATDAVRLRTARVVLSGAVPVVGGILSEASDSLLAAAASLRSAVGLYGMLAILAVCAAPFLQIAVQYVILKATAAVSGLFGQAALTELIGRLSDALGLLLAMTGAYMTAALLCAAMAMRVVGT